MNLDKQEEQAAARASDLASELAGRGSDSQLQAILELTPDGYLAFDHDHRVCYVNPGFARLTGLDAAALIGCDENAVSELFAARCTRPERFAGLARLRAAAAGDAPSGPDASQRHNVVELRAPAGRIIEINLLAAPTGDITQVLHLRDITRESEVDRMKSEFLAHAAHELRNPMASILGFSELMLKGNYYSEAERQELLGIIFRQSSLVASLINERLDLMRIEARRGKDFELLAIDPGELLGEAIAGFGIPEERLPPALSLPETPCRLRADRKKMLQVLNNLLSNAYKYSPQGGAVTITVSDGTAHGQPRHVALSVSDQGIGMTAEQSRRVFERFYRADSSGSIPGTGLGMCIVKEIVELHDGYVFVDSQPGRGTTVTILIPRA